MFLHILPQQKMAVFCHVKISSLTNQLFHYNMRMKTLYHLQFIDLPYFDQFQVVFLL